MTHISSNLVVDDFVRLLTPHSDDIYILPFQHAATDLVVSYVPRVNGYGVFTTEPIEEGDAILEYCGELISIQRLKARKQSHMDTSYCMHVHTDVAVGAIDSRMFGNLARFVNHSCEPNSIAYLQVKEYIQRGAEITMDYFIFDNTMDASYLGQLCRCFSY